MELDKRIKDTGSIMTCFTAAAAKKFVGQQGYFADEIHAYHNLDNIDFSTLYRVDDDHIPFCVASGLCYQFFLPAEFVRPAEKKWRPFTLDEFMAKFPLGSPVTYRYKIRDEYVYTVWFIGYERNEERLNLGGLVYKFEELVNDYELKDEDGNWVPFGVEEE